MTEGTLEDLSTKLAVHCQSFVRGSKARNQTLIKRWEKANIAAFRIQREFRRWKLLKIVKKRTKSQKFKNREPKRDEVWQRILDSEATFDDKMGVWRMVIELRRGYRHYSTDICAKALIQANGNISKATTLLGTSDFVFNASNSPPLGDEYKELLNPFAGLGFQLNGLSQGGYSTHSSSGNRRAHRNLPQSSHNKRPLGNLESIAVKVLFSSKSPSS